MVVSSVEIQNNFGKYIDLAASQEIVITRNGSPIARLLGMSEPVILSERSNKKEEQSKYDTLSNFFGIAKGGNFDKSDKELLAESLVEKYESLN